MKATKTNSGWSMDSYSSTADTYADWGFKAEAKVEKISFTVGTSGHYEFAYGVMVGTSSSSSLSYSGASFSMPSGASSGETGSKYVSLSEFN